MKSSGIDVDVYKPHSTRSASTSAASKMGASLDYILKAASWKSATTIRTFYNKTIVDESKFSNVILSNAQSTSTT